MNSSCRLERRHLAVQLLEGLGRVAELTEEHPQQVLGLERGDRRLDAVAGDVADDRRDPGRRQAEDVVEVAGHQPGAGLVDPADLEAGEVGQILGRQALGPPAGRQLLLGQHLSAPGARADAALGQAGLVARRCATIASDTTAGTARSTRTAAPDGGSMNASGTRWPRRRWRRSAAAWRSLRKTPQRQRDGAARRRRSSSQRSARRRWRKRAERPQDSAAARHEHGGGREDRDHHDAPIVLAGPGRARGPDQSRRAPDPQLEGRVARGRRPRGASARGSAGRWAGARGWRTA